MNDVHSGTVKVAVIGGVFLVISALIGVLVPPLLEDDEDGGGNNGVPIAADLR